LLKKGQFGIPFSIIYLVVVDLGDHSIKQPIRTSSNIQTKTHPLHDLHDTSGLQPVPATPRYTLRSLRHAPSPNARALELVPLEPSREPGDGSTLRYDGQKWTKCDSKTWEQFSDLSDFGKLREPQGGHCSLHIEIIMDDHHKL